MMMIKRILCMLGTLLLACTALTACGTGSSEQSAPDASVAEESQAEAPEVSYTANEIAEARRVAEQYVAACTAGDPQAVEKYSNAKECLQYLYGDAYTDDMLESLAANWAELFARLESYEIGDAIIGAEELGYYNEGVAKIRAEAEADADGADDETLALIESTLKWVQPIEKLVVFPAEATASDGTTGNEQLRIAFANGRWFSDVMMVDLVLSEVMEVPEESEPLQYANQAAKNIELSATTALADLDAEGVDISLLSGDYMLTGEDFAAAAAVDDPQTESQVLAAMQYRMMQYFPDAASLETVMFRIKEGVCTAAAAEYEGAFGAYPNAADESAALQSIEGALHHAAYEEEN